VHADDGVELVLAHLHDRLVAQDACVVDEDVEGAVRVDGAADEALGPGPVADVVVVGDGLAAPLGDDADHLVGRALVGAVAGDARAEVVHDDLGTLGGQLERLATADADARAGDDGDLPVQQPHGGDSPRKMTLVSVATVKHRGGAGWSVETRSWVGRRGSRRSPSSGGRSTASPPR
jgi:hypothetical protein